MPPISNCASSRLRWAALARGLGTRLRELGLVHGHFHGPLADLDVGQLRLGHAHLLGGLLARGAFVVGFEHE